MSSRYTKLTQISVDLKELLRGLEVNLESFKQSRQKFMDHSAEYYAQFKEKLIQKIDAWQHIIQQAKEFIKALPKEIRQREMFGSFLKELDRYESATKNYFKNLDFSSLQDYRLNLYSSAKHFKEEVNLFYARISALQHNPLIQKLIEGKKVLASRKNLQWGRKLFHTFNGLFGLWLYGYSGMSETGVMIILASLLTFSVIIEIARYYSDRFNDFICKSLSGIMRERERNKISSGTWYMGAILIVFLIFPKDVGILTLLLVALGDTAAGIVGTIWGKHKITQHVSLEGFLAAFSVCFLSTLIFTAWWLPSFHLSGLPLIGFTLLAGLTGAVSEGAFKKLDDNLVIPLLSAPSLWLLMKAFG